MALDVVQCQHFFLPVPHKFTTLFSPLIEISCEFLSSTSSIMCTILLRREIKSSSRISYSSTAVVSSRKTSFHISARLFDSATSAWTDRREIVLEHKMTFPPAHD